MQSCRSYYNRKRGITGSGNNSNEEKKDIENVRRVSLIIASSGLAKPKLDINENSDAGSESCRLLTK